MSGDLAPSEDGISVREQQRLDLALNPPWATAHFGDRR
jgi:hypothetical protein